MPKFRFSLRNDFAWPLVVAIIAFGAFWLKPWQEKPQETISVQALGKTQVVPDIAKIDAQVESKNPNLDVARRENEQKIGTIIAKLKELGIEEKDIKTQYFSAGPGYEIQIFPAPRPNTNQLTTTLEITIRNFDNTNEVLAALTQNGATNLYGPNLTISDSKLEEAKSKAREDAVKNARGKAEELAILSSRKLGKVVKIEEQGDFAFPPPIIAQSESDLKQKASIIEPGQNEITINLLVDFSLK